MITKQRLEELIEQGATIYVVNNKVVFEEKLNKHYTHDVLKDCVCWWGIPRKRWFFKDCFETKEEAEWHKEFGCVERTERLELPTWEEFKNDGEFSFLDKQGFEWDLYSPDDETRISLVGGYDHYEFDYTKENYTLACRKCKELFLGETK